MLSKMVVILNVILRIHLTFFFSFSFRFLGFPHSLTLNLLKLFMATSNVHKTKPTRKKKLKASKFSRFRFAPFGWMLAVPEGKRCSHFFTISLAPFTHSFSLFLSISSHFHFTFLDCKFSDSWKFGSLLSWTGIESQEKSHGQESTKLIRFMLKLHWMSIACIRTLWLLYPSTFALSLSFSVRMWIYHQMHECNSKAMAHIHVYIS